MVTDSYWLARFVDEVELKKPEEIEKLFGSEQLLQRLLDIAHETAAVERDRRVGDADTWEILAGRMVDLSGLLSCGSPACLKRQVEAVFSKVWHYFDRIVVEGLAPGRLGRACPCDLRSTLKPFVESHLELVLHLRRIGALPYLRFVTKPVAFCDSHYRQHASALGLPGALGDGMAQEVIAHLVAEGTLEKIEGPNGRWVFVYRHPDLAFDYVTGAEAEDSVTIEEIAVMEYVWYTTAAVADVVFAQEIGVPLATTAERILQLASGKRAQATSAPGSLEDAVALNLRLPVLEGLGARDLLQLRTDHRAEFTRFRGALRAAIREHVAGVEEDRDPRKVARAVTAEYVEPALADIEARLEASRRALRRKSFQTVAVGGVMAGIGLLTAMPLLVGTGVAAGASAVAHLNKYADEKREVELADSYFLWQVAHGHR